MARTALTAVASSEAGIDLTAVDTAAEVTDGNSFVWTKDRRVWILNGDDASITVTFPTPVTVGRSALAVADTSGTISAGAHKLFGPFGPEYRQADGTVHINYAGTTPTGVTVAVLD
jgi:alkylation response protein AidB-like acyl-CoA dehydrogenase